MGIRNKKLLIEKRNKLMDELKNIKPFIEGSLGKVNRICGNPNCQCRTDSNKKHPALYFTWKENRKTQALYVPVVMWEEAKTWNTNFKTLKQIIKNISEIQRKILKLR
jgi:hypothetical protein